MNRSNVHKWFVWIWGGVTLFVLALVILSAAGCGTTPTEAQEPDHTPETFQCWQRGQGITYCHWRPEPNVYCTSVTLNRAAHDFGGVAVSCVEHGGL